MAGSIQDALAAAIPASALQLPPGVQAQQDNSAPKAPPLGAAMTQFREDDSRVQSAEEARDKFEVEGRPKFPELGEAPKAEENKDPMQGYVSAIGVLGAIGSMFIRTPMTHAMNAAAGVLQGIKADDAATFKQKYETWKTQNDNALKLFDYQNDTYKAILNDKNKGVDERIAELKANAAAFKDDITMRLAADRNPAVIEEHLAKADEARAKWQELSDKLAARGMKFNLAKQQIEEAKNSGKPMTPEAQIKLLTEAMSDKVAGGGASSLSPEALHLAATTYLATGTMPNLGMGGKEDKEAVLNEASKLAEEQGVNAEDIVSGRASFKADSSALATVTKNAAQIEGFEETTDLNMQNALKLMNKGAGTSAGPVVNRWLQAGKKETGDPDVKAFNSAIETAITEYAKVMSGAVGATPLTDSARKEVHDQILSAIDSPEAIKAVYEKTMVPDMKNRVKGYDDQKNALKASLRSETKPAGTSTQPYSQEDLEHTAKIHNMTVEEVKKKLGVE